MNGPRRVTDLLGRQESTLSDLVRLASQQQRLDALLQAFLDRPLRDHVRVAGVRDGTLVLAADTPVWGHRVRYLAPALLAHMRATVPGLAQVRIIVRPADPTPQAVAPVTRSPIPSSAAGALSQAARDCDNPALAEVLRRMARRAR